MMPSRTATFLSLAVGAAAVMIFVYCSGYYASDVDVARIATSPYALVVCLHLLVPLAVGLMAVVMTTRSSAPTAVATCLWLVIALVPLIVSANFVRALIGFGLPGDSASVDPSGFAPPATGSVEAVAVSLSRPLGRSVMAAVMAAGLVAAYVLRRRSHQLTRWIVFAVVLCATSALLSFLYLAKYLITSVSWDHYGGIHAFCVMALCLLVLPLAIAAFSALVLMRPTVSSVAVLVWLVVSFAGLALLVFTIGELARGNVFVQSPSSSSAPELHGICALMANRHVFGTICVGTAAAVAFVIVRAVRANLVSEPS